MVINQLAKATADLGGAFSGERIKYSLEMTALGLVAVFAVLALIWLILAIFKLFLYDSSNKKSKSSTQEKTVNVEQKVESAPAPTTENDAIVAAITSAISAYIAEDPQLSEQYANGFKVVSFKRVRDKAFWNSKK